MPTPTHFGGALACGRFPEPLLRQVYWDDGDAAFLVPHPAHKAGSAVALVDLSHWEDAVGALKLFEAHAVAINDLTVAWHTKIVDILRYLDASLLWTSLRRLDMSRCGEGWGVMLLPGARQELLGCFRSFHNLHTLNLAHNAEVNVIFTLRYASTLLHPLPVSSAGR